MPIYCYSEKVNDEFVGKVHEEFIQCSANTTPPATMTVDGKVLHRDLMAEHGGFRHLGEKEFTSEAMAVRPEEIPAMIADSRKHGVEPKRYTADGCPVFGGAKHKDRYMKVYGYHANNSYT